MNWKDKFKLISILIVANTVAAALSLLTTHITGGIDAHNIEITTIIWFGISGGMILGVNAAWKYQP